jgi:hypothetical protein
MLNNHTQEIRECYQQAAHCVQQAEAQNDPNVQRQFLELTRRWLLLAGSNRFSFRFPIGDDGSAGVSIAAVVALALATALAVVMVIATSPDPLLAFRLYFRVKVRMGRFPSDIPTAH